MPTPLEPFVETKEGSKTEHEHRKETTDSASGDSQKNKQQSSPRRKFVNRSNNNHNGNRNNRNNSLNKRSTNDNNNNNNNSKQFSGYKAQIAMNQQQQKMTMQNDYQKPQQNEQVDPKKPSNHSNKFRSITKLGPMTSYFDDRSPPASTSPTTEPQQSKFSMPQPKHEIDNMQQRKYSMDFLHQVGYKITNVNGMNMPPAQHSPKTPKHIDEANLMALKMALGDNSGYYTHFYAGSMYGNQMVLHQQQQQQLNQFRYQQPPIQRIQRMYPRAPQDNYQRVYQPPRFQEQEGAANLSCHCSQQAQPQFQRSYSNSYSSSSYQNGNKNERRDYRDNRDNNSKKGRNGYGYNHNDRGYKKDFHNRSNQSGKSHSFSDEDTNKTKNLNRDDHVYRSLSPTPPNSSVSSSPGAHEKNIEKNVAILDESNLERAEDSASTASASSSVPSSSGNLMVSQSVPILVQPEEPAKNVNLWINNNFGAKTLRNGLSVSAENLNSVFRDQPITVIKRQPSVHEIVERNPLQVQRSLSNLSYDPQQPFDYYLSRADDSEMRVPPAQLRCGSQWDRLSEDMWEKFILSQQSRSTYRKKMLLWRDLHGSVKVSVCKNLTLQSYH